MSAPFRRRALAVAQAMAQALVLAAPLAAQPVARPAGLTPRAVAPPDTARARRARHREPLVAAALGVVPGLGHVYAGEPLTGVAVFAVSTAGTALMFGSHHTAAMSAGAVVYVGSLVFSVADAGFAAQRFNRRHAAPAGPPVVATRAR